MKSLLIIILTVVPFLVMSQKADDLKNRVKEKYKGEVVTPTNAPAQPQSANSVATNNCNCQKLNAEIDSLERELRDLQAKFISQKTTLEDLLNKKESSNASARTNNQTSQKLAAANAQYDQEIKILEQEIQKKLANQQPHFAMQIPAKTLYKASCTAYVIDPAAAKGNIQLYLADENNVKYRSFSALQKDIKFKSKNKKSLLFAMNAGMFTPTKDPVGLLVIDSVQLQGIKLGQMPGNFGLKPNGVFVIEKSGRARVVESNQYMKIYNNNENVQYATQSGPMLLIDGKYHPKLNRWSKNKYVRNGVGVLPDGRLVFVISRGLTNFYDFATLFKAMGCQNALYLDGAISGMYCPEAGMTRLNGDFGPMIGITN